MTNDTQMRVTGNNVSLRQEPSTGAAIAASVKALADEQRGVRNGKAG